MKHKIVTDGEWYEVPLRYSHCCCDCLCTHKIDFMRRNGKLWIRYRRDKRATSAARAWKKRNAMEQT